MKRRVVVGVGLWAGLSALGLSVVMAAPSAAGNYGRELLKQVIHVNRDVVAAAISAVPPKSAKAVIISAGGGAGATDLSPTPNEATTSTVSAAGDRLEVRLALHDVSGDSVGALSLTYAYHAGADRSALEHSAERIRDRLHRRISHAGNLFDPFPYDADAPAQPYAQRLVDEFLDKYPEIEIIAIHATPPDSDYNIIAGSNIGRLGKKADNDDMRCIYTGKPNLEINSTGKRFESEMQLHDRAGNVIGAVGIVAAYKSGDDKEALYAHAEQIRAELEKRIPDSASLFRPAGAAPL